MAIIAKNLKDNKNYVLIGTVLNINDGNENVWGSKLIALADSKGKIIWEYSNSVLIVEVDGKSINEYLKN